ACTSSKIPSSFRNSSNIEPVCRLLFAMLPLRTVNSGWSQFLRDRSVATCQALTMLDQFVDRQTNVLCDLAEQNWRHIAAAVVGNSSSAAVRVPKLLVRPVLADFRKPKAFKIAMTS